MLLSRQGRSLKEVVDVLREFAGIIEGADDSEGAQKRDILQHLTAYLEGCI